VVILGVLVLLDHFHVSITPMLTALGVGGLAVALAMQDTLSNLFGGFYVAVAGQVRLGDYIKLNTGEEGYVTDIGWRSTTIRSLGNSMIIVPNAKLAQAIVTNYDLPEKRMSATVEVRVSLDCDPDHIERVLLDTAAQSTREIPGMLADPAPTVTFDPGFGDSALASRSTTRWPSSPASSVCATNCEGGSSAASKRKASAFRSPPGLSTCTRPCRTLPSSQSPGRRSHKRWIRVVPFHTLFVFSCRLPLAGVRGIFGAHLIATANPAEYSERRNRRTACVSPRLARFQIVRRIE